MLQFQGPERSRAWLLRVNRGEGFKVVAAGQLCLVGVVCISEIIVHILILKSFKVNCSDCQACDGTRQGSTGWCLLYSLYVGTFTAVLLCCSGVVWCML